MAARRTKPAPATTAESTPTGTAESPAPIQAWVYLVRCRDGSLYCGWTVDVAKRVAAHNAGRGAAYTRSRKPVSLAWCEQCPDKSAALRREIAIKRLTRRKKLLLVGVAARS
jgi:putative endonuclease